MADGTFIGATDNELSQKLTGARRGRVTQKSTNINVWLYKKYLADPTAQYQMTFYQWKKKNRRKKPD